MKQKSISAYPPRTQSSWRGILEDRLPQEFNQAFQYLKQNNLVSNTVFDIGANSGFFTKAIKRIYPDIRVIGFEAFDFHKPVHDFFEWETYFVGLSDVNAVKDFYLVPENDEINRIGGGNSYYKENAVYGQIDYNCIVPVQVCRLDDFVEQNSLPQPELIKIDVQGAELDVIEGGIHTVRQANALIVEVQFVEYNLGAPDYKIVFQKLQELGFSKFSKIHQTQYDGDFLFLK